MDYDKINEYASEIIKLIKIYKSSIIHSDLLKEKITKKINELYKLIGEN